MYNESKEEYYDDIKDSLQSVNNDGDDDDDDVLTPRLNQRINVQLPKPKTKGQWM